MSERWFLDTQQWNYLVEKDGENADYLAELRSRLVALAKRKVLRVIGSLPLLQEVISTGPNHPDKYDAMRKLIFETVGHRWVIPLNLRHSAEIACGSVLGQSRAYIPGQQRRRLEELALRDDDVLAVANGTFDEVTAFKKDQENIRQRLLDTAHARDGLTPREFRLQLDSWFRSADIDSWIRPLLKQSVVDSLPSGSELSSSTAPSAWHFTKFKLARIKLNLADRRAIKPSDYNDAEHYAVGPYYDVLVTDDSALRETIDLLDDCPFRVVGFSELEQALM